MKDQYNKGTDKQQPGQGQNQKPGQGQNQRPGQDQGHGQKDQQKGGFNRPGDMDKNK